MQILWWAAIALSAIGLFTRVMMALSFILALIILSVPVGFLNSNFQYYLPTVVLGIYAFSHAGDYFSLDAWLAKKWAKKDKISRDPSEYGWTRALILFNVSMMYFGAGLSKLKYSGLSWAQQEGFLRHIEAARANFQENLFYLTDEIFVTLKANPILSLYVGFAVLAFELSSPIAFFLRRTLPIYLTLWILFHIGIALMMGIWVSYWFVPVFLVLLPWQSILARFPVQKVSK